jgi:hypothetical protein
MILGIDPGAQTGIAVFRAGKLDDLVTIQPHELAECIKANKPSRVIFEDSRLTSFMFTQVKSRAAALKMARNVGEIDAWCRLITAVCGELNIAFHGISPKDKGAKLNAAQFAKLTGWIASSNQHERDAATVAWLYRSAAK